MSNEIIISPIEYAGYIFEIDASASGGGYIIESELSFPTLYDVVIENINNSEESIEVFPIGNNNDIELFPQDITGDIFEVQPVINNGYIIELFAGVGQSNTFPITYKFSNKNVVSIPHNLYKEVDYKIESIVDEITGEYEAVIPDKIIRRDLEMDIYVYPKMTIKVTIYP